MLKKLSVNLFLLVFLLLTCSITSTAQISSDSLRSLWEDVQIADSIRFKAINKYYRNYTFAEPDTALLLTGYHYAIAKKRDSKAEMSNALNERSYAYYLMGDPKSSMVALKESIAILEQMDNPKGLANVYSNIGNIYGEENKYQEAIQYFYKTLTIFQDENYKTGEARILNNIGLVYYHIGSYDLALENLMESINIYYELGRDKKAVSLLADVGAIYYEQGKYNEAIVECRKSLSTLIEYNNKFAISNCYFLIAKSFHKLGDKQETRSNLNKSIAIVQKLKNNSKLIEVLTFDAELYFDTDIDNATKKAEAVQELVKADTKNEQKVDLYELLYRCYKSQNRYDLSLSMHEKHVMFSDSLEMQKSKASIVREAIQNEYEAKIYKNQLKNEETQGQLKVDHLKKTYTIGIISVILLLGVFLYSRSVIKASNKKKDSLLVEIDRLKNIDSSIVAQTNKFELDKDKIESFIDRKLNETDWLVLNILLDDPVIPNKEIAKKAFMSVDGIGSSLRRMYGYFDIKESKYKKISLLMLAIKLSNN